MRAALLMLMVAGIAQADGEQPKDASERSPTGTYANGKPYDELLCTICGLTSCWQSPKNAAASAPKA